MAPKGRSRGRDNLVESLLANCRKDSLVAAGGTVVVGFSGGPDSTALLHGLRRVARVLDLRLTAVHVDHGLRAASALHAEHALRVAAELGLPVEVVRVAPRGGGEDAARQARYRALETLARRLGAHSVALGHTAGDQAETVLLHLLRGSGLEGLGGMSLRHGLRFRPLLEVTRLQVESYCARQLLDTVHDESNDDMAFARNRVRHELIPLLEDRFNPRVQEALARLARSARAEHEAVRLAAITWRSSQGGQLNRSEFIALPGAIQVEVLRSEWAAVAGGRRPGGAARLEQALRLARGGGRGMIQMGAGTELVADAEQLQIRLSRRSSEPPRTSSRVLTEP